MIEFLTSDIDVPHGFFTRKGGVSSGPYDSLNCGQFGMDDVSCVIENRSRAIRALGGDPDRLVSVKQVHGNRVVTVTATWQPEDIQTADALVTTQRGLALGIITADCAPVLFADTTGKIVGAAHAGWRGALAGVLEQTVEAMRALGAETINAAIGPCIGAESYEVTADLHDAIVADDPENERYFTVSDPVHWNFDLPGYVDGRLQACGVSTAVMRIDTFADEERFFSYRRRTKRHERFGGHQISVIRNAG